jgi:hypothetical protein
VKGIPMSDFITPAYFEVCKPASVRFDYYEPREEAV